MKELLLREIAVWKMLFCINFPSLSAKHFEQCPLSFNLFTFLYKTGHAFTFSVIAFSPLINICHYFYQWFKSFHFCFIYSVYFYSPALTYSSNMSPVSELNSMHEITWVLESETFGEDFIVLIIWLTVWCFWATIFETCFHLG